MTSATSTSDILPPEALAVPDQGLDGVADGAEAIVSPRSTEEVAEAVRWAGANDVGILPVGSGERVHRVQGEGRFLVLSTSQLAGFEIYEPGDVTLTARAGTPLLEIEEALHRHRQWLPFDPPAVSRRTLGGLVAAGESGPLGTGYGELKSHVLGATVVCGDGRVLCLGGRVVKNVAGFDLLRPVVGSRGRLGVVTSVCVRAFPVPVEDRVLAFRAGEVSELAAVARSVRTAPVLPVSSTLWVPARAAGGGAVLLVRLHGAPATVAADQATLERHAGIEFERPADPMGLMRDARDGAVGGAATVRFSVLASRLFEGVAAARRRLGEAELVADAYAGTARLALAGSVGDELRQLQIEIEALGGVLTVDVSGGGTELAGIGTSRSEAEVELSTRIAEVFDPPGVFWPCHP